MPPLKTALETKDWVSITLRIIVVLITLFGGAIAFGSLQGKVSDHDIAIPDHERRIRTLETDVNVERRVAQERHEQVMGAIKELKEALNTHGEQDRRSQPKR